VTRRTAPDNEEGCTGPTTGRHTREAATRPTYLRALTEFVGALVLRERRATMLPVLRRIRTRLPAVATCVAVGLLASCSGSDDAGDAERFCGEVQVNAAQLTQPDLQFSDDIEPLLELYREIGTLAPIAIEPEWDQLIDAYETASTVVPGDPESEQSAIAAIFSTEQSAAAVDSWLVANCAVDIGPVFTIVAQDG
jgi:hypothetical protein